MVKGQFTEVISVIKWIWTSRLSPKNSLSPTQIHHDDNRVTSAALHGIADRVLLGDNIIS